MHSFTNLLHFPVCWTGKQRKPGKIRKFYFVKESFENLGYLEENIFSWWTFFQWIFQENLNYLRIWKCNLKINLKFYKNITLENPNICYGKARKVSGFYSWLPSSNRHPAIRLRPYSWCYSTNAHKNVPINSSLFRLGLR